MADDPSSGTWGGLPIDGVIGVQLQGGSVVMTGGTVTAGSIVVTAGTVTIPGTPVFNGRFLGTDGTAYSYKVVDGKPRVSSVSYLYDIAEGNVTDHTAFMKLGYNGDVGATEEDIITQGGVYPWLAAATAMVIQSSSTADTLAGSGVQKVRVNGLTATYAATAYTVDMNGTAAVAVGTLLRVNSVRATQVGAGAVAAGTITVTEGATVYRAIEPGFTRGRGLTYTVPLGKTLYITSVDVSSGYTTAGKVVRWTGRAQVDDTDPTTKINFFQPFFETITQDAGRQIKFDMPRKIPATADLKISAYSNGAGSFCECMIEGWLE